MGERETRSIVIVAACALLNEAREVLIAKRPPGRSLAGLWEFPGGKVEQGEGPEEALIRELKEELGIEIAKVDLNPLTFASHAYPDFHLLMPVYLCARWRGTLAAQEGQELLWVRPEDLVRYDMPPADEPLKVALRDLL
ncbi:MAG TPA: 8-oxo-dGTP diphosphatase MutT [Methyloceanibacter sp.]|nr:8-oxo-dGTP diphosphatase MutT [Methyloceanibacter sp.]